MARVFHRALPAGVALEVDGALRRAASAVPRVVRGPSRRTAFGVAALGDSRLAVSPDERRRDRRELNVGDLVYNIDTLNVERCEKEIYLNPIGLKLLHCLMEASPNVVSRSDLELEVWGEEMPDSDSLRVHIHSLRSAIDKPFQSNMIQTRHGIGYRMVESDAVSAPA